MNNIKEKVVKATASTLGCGLALICTFILCMFAYIGANAVITQDQFQDETVIDVQTGSSYTHYIYTSGTLVNLGINFIQILINISHLYIFSFISIIWLADILSIFTEDLRNIIQWIRRIRIGIRLNGEQP